MPSAHPPAKVLVTGATGFIGAWTARTFLERGYDVRGTVRSRSKGEWLANQAWSKSAPGKFEYVIVEDLEAVGAFDAAVQGDITIVAHTASPVIFDAKLDPYDLINPAVKGTVGVLESILNHGLLLSVLSLHLQLRLFWSLRANPVSIQRGIFDFMLQEDWNEYSVREIETNGISSDPIHKYRASKVKAERAVWAFVEKYKGKVNFEVTTILPGMVYGPIIHEVPSVDKLNETVDAFYQNLRKEVLPTDFSILNFADVRDVAQMHVDAVASDRAAGQRFIVAAGPYIWQDIYDALNAHSHPFTGVPIGKPGAGKNVKRLVLVDTKKAVSLLGTKYRSLGEMAYDTLASLKERGFW